MPPTIADFVARWRAAGAEERANKDSFFIELCSVLGIAPPDPKRGDPALDTYVFEADVRWPNEAKAASVRKIDVYRAGAFILEAKQGQDKEETEAARKLNKAKRGTPAWEEAMNGARGQALGYARMMAKPPPFLVIADLGYCFDLYAAFDGTDHYTPFPDTFKSRVYFVDLEANAALLRAVFTDPLTLDPARKMARVTDDIAGHLAGIAQSLESDGNAPEAVATFLMRCIFTMFAEDVGLLPQYPNSNHGVFTGALEHLWKPNPRAFPAGVEGFWRAMNAGTDFGFIGKLLRFNGGLFAEPTALSLTAKQLDLLLEAAKCDWSEVEPAIFGTLIERALDPKERHALGAHYTPRAYVERLVRPTIEEPLRADWDLVQAQVRQLIDDAGPEPERPVTLSAEELRARGTKADQALMERYGREMKAREATLKKARLLVHAFHQKLCAIRVLDPACGSGNFLYVALDLFQHLEDEVLAKLRALGESQEALRAETIRVSPAQFLGIEIKRWAKEVAELVLWIGFLQHHMRLYGTATPPSEPVLQDFKNIECRDAVLAWDSQELVRDAQGKPVTRWDGDTMKTHPVTGAQVPDESAQVAVYRYVNPRKAEWPKADFIVGNPPFVGTRRMRLVLGDGYVEALTTAIPDVSREADFVMYWWDQAACSLVEQGTLRFGLITTNSISQSFSRATIQRHLVKKNPISIVFAIPDHPWVDSAEGAAVRVAMTVGEAGLRPGQLLHVRSETAVDRVDALEVQLTSPVVGTISQDLRVGVSPASAVPLMSNTRVAYLGAKFYGDGFIVTRERASSLAATHAGHNVGRPFLSARDFTSRARNLWVLDCDGLSESELRDKLPATYQHLLEHVKPVRAQNPRPLKRDRWWILGENQPGMRRAVAQLERYVVSPETAKHRVFQFIPRAVLAEGGLA